MSLIPMNVEQMRRKAIENAKAKQQKQKDFENQVNQMSRHNVGSNLDVREIIKSKQFKEQKIIMTHIKQNRNSEICSRVMDCILTQMVGLTI